MPAAEIVNGIASDGAPRSASTVLERMSLGRLPMLSLHRGVLIAYLLALTLVYPYGISFGGGFLRAPDVFAFLALAMGLCTLAMRGSVRVDAYLVVGMLPFLVLELSTPVLGAVGEAQWSAAASSARMALLWLPALLYFVAVGREGVQKLDQGVRTVFKIALVANFVYALVQDAVFLGAVPRALLITELLEPWAVDPHYRVLDGLRVSGFFVNTTDLSVFALVVFAYFYSRYITDRGGGDLLYGFLALLLVVLTTARMAVFASLLILASGWIVLRPGGKLRIVLLCVIAGTAVALVVEQIIGLEQVFYRFTRLFEAGVLQDYSLQHRMQLSWPAAMRAADAYPIGTLISAPRVIELIDSGYLTYFVQGKWLFVTALGWMLVVLTVRGSLGFFRVRDRRSLFLLFLAIYLLIALITTNPMRSPLMIFAVLHGLYLSQGHLTLRPGRPLALVHYPARAR